MNPKCYIILVLIFISSSVISICSAQTDTIHKPIIPIIKVKDTIKTDTITHPDMIVDEIIDNVQKEPLNFIIGKSVLNKSLWAQRYRYVDKKIKSLSVRITIENLSGKKESLDFNLFSLLLDEKKLRIRPTGIFYYKKDKKVYLRSKPLNKNYNVFEEHVVEGYLNSEEKTYKVNFLGLKKNKSIPIVQSLKKMTIKSRKISYYIDFPVYETFTYGKIYYKDKPIGFAAVKN
jgi:hypothetical protein